MEKLTAWQILAIILALYILYMHISWRTTVDGQVRSLEMMECYKLFLNNSDMFGNLLGGNNSTPVNVVNWTLEDP